MDCTRVRSLLHPWLDGELDREEHRAVLEHMGKCEQCDARLRDEQRLLARVKQGLAAPCPAALRARLLADIHAAPRPGSRGLIITFRVAAAAAAVLVVAAVWADPICVRGCPTVRALVQEHLTATPAIVTSDAALAAQRLVGERVPECEGCGCCTGLGDCIGVRAIECTPQGCMVFYKDGKGRPISFVKMKGSHLHPWLTFRATADGLICARQDGCRFLGWKDGDGDICGLLAGESVGQDDLIAISERVRVR